MTTNNNVEKKQYSNGCAISAFAELVTHPNKQKIMCYAKIFKSLAIQGTFKLNTIFTMVQLASPWSLWLLCKLNVHEIKSNEQKQSNWGKHQSQFQVNLSSALQPTLIHTPEPSFTQKALLSKVLRSGSKLLKCKCLCSNTWIWPIFGNWCFLLRIRTSTRLWFVWIAKQIENVEKKWRKLDKNSRNKGGKKQSYYQECNAKLVIIYY